MKRRGRGMDLPLGFPRFFGRLLTNLHTDTYTGTELIVVQQQTVAFRQPCHPKSQGPNHFPFHSSVPNPFCRSQPNPTETPPSSLRQRRLRPLLQRQMRNRITRISHIHRLPRLIIIRHQLHINRDLVIRGAAEVGPQGRHGGVDVVEADIVRRDGGAALVLREPEAHDAPGARVGPVPHAGRDGAVGHGGAGVVDDGDAVFPCDVVAGTVVEELGAVGSGGGD